MRWRPHSPRARRRSGRRSPWLSAVRRRQRVLVDLQLLEHQQRSGGLLPLREHTIIFNRVMTYAETLLPHRIVCISTRLSHSEQAAARLAAGASYTSRLAAGGSYASALDAIAALAAVAALDADAALDAAVHTPFHPHTAPAAPDAASATYPTAGAPDPPLPAESRVESRVWSGVGLAKPTKSLGIR